MRKLKLQVQLSIDGFVAGKNGEMDWMVFNWDNKLKAYVNEITKPVDTILLGRKLAQGFIDAWSSRASDPAGEDPWFIRKMNDSLKLVFSRDPSKVELTNADNAKVAKGDLLGEVNKQKGKVGGDIIAYGGAEFVSSLIENRLIDEYYFFVNPVALGKGMSIFKRLDEKLGLALEGTQAFDCGITVLCYRPERT